MSTKKSILIIDDSNSALLLMDWILQNEGYETFAVPGVKEGIEVLKDHSPDLIILDLQMPVISGYDFLKMKNSMAIEKVPVIIVSAVDSKDSVDLTKNLGANDFIAKPLKPKLLIELVKKYLG
jgi:DNA-binding response OmpR family regulator